MFGKIAKYRVGLMSAAVAAVTVLALVATSSTVSAQTPTPAAPKATPTAAAPAASPAAAPAKTAAPAPGKTGTGGLAGSATTSTMLILGFVLVAGTAVVIGRRATSSR